MKTLNEQIEQQLKAPEFADAWREGEREYQAMRVRVEASVTLDRPAAANKARPDTGEVMEA